MGLESARPMSFEEWEAQNQDLIAELESHTCPECEGEGECKCPECGHDMICPECDGKGYTGDSPKQIYRKMLERDKKKVEEFLKLVARKRVVLYYRAERAVVSLKTPLNQYPREVKGLASLLNKIIRADKLIE